MLDAVIKTCNTDTYGFLSLTVPPPPFFLLYSNTDINIAKMGGSNTQIPTSSYKIVGGSYTELFSPTK